MHVYIYPHTHTLILYGIIAHKYFEIYRMYITLAFFRKTLSICVIIAQYMSSLLRFLYA